MIGGVNFQPGQQAGNAQLRPKASNSAQEAIKILSLRLPKQVGPNALAPAALLNAQGSGGNPRVDSVVSQVMGRMFPQGQPEQPPQPMVPSMPGANAPQFGGDSRPAGNTPLSSMMPTAQAPQQPTRAPRITPIEGRAPGITFENPAPPNMNPSEWPSQTPPPPPGSTFDGNYTRWPTAPAPTVPDDQNGTMPPPQRIDFTQPDREVPQAPPAPTQDPWADLMNYIRRKNETPEMQGDTPIR